MWPAGKDSLPGQHVDIRLTAEDGDQAQRSYSIASPPEDELIALTVVRVDNGEVSPYLHGELRRGDQFELRGQIRGYFIWTTAVGVPLQLIGGGSGVAPLTAMLRHRDRRDDHGPAVLPAVLVVLARGSRSEFRAPFRQGLEQRFLLFDTLRNQLVVCSARVRGGLFDQLAKVLAQSRNVFIKLFDGSWEFRHGWTFS